MTRHLELGRRAEDRAVAHLESLGWRVLGRNLVNPCGELDIVATDPDGELVVVEVRCRTVGKVQSPLDSVGPQKLRRLVRAGRTHVERTGWTGPWRIDLIGFWVSGVGPASADSDAEEPRWRLEHVRDITCGMEALS